MSDDARLTRAPAGLPPLHSERVGWWFIARYALAYMSTGLLFLAPALVSLALKVNSLVGLDRAPNSLALIASIGALVSMVGNPFFGRLSDRTTWRWGRRRPWLILGLAGGSTGIAVVAVAPTIPVVLLGWCLAQLAFNALLAALVAVLPDQVPVAQRGMIGGILGISLPVASVIGTFLVKLFEPNLISMFLAPCIFGAVFVVLFAVTMKDPQHDSVDQPRWSTREFLTTFYVSPRQHPSFAWAFASRFMFVLAYAFLTTYQAYFLLDQLGTAEADVPQQIFLGTAVQASATIVASLAGGTVSDRTGRRKVFVAGAAIIYGLALFLIAVAGDFNGFLVGMAISGLGFGLYMAVDLALVVDVLPTTGTSGKDLGVLNIAGALPSSLAPALAPVILAFGAGSYGVLYVVAGACAVLAAVAILPVKGVR